jgi:MerR family transcriptional regulator, light-induced transcriptional regulator
MRDVGNHAQEGRDDNVIVDLAFEAIRRLADKRLSGSGILQEELVTKILDAVKSDKNPDLEEVVQELQTADISAEAAVLNVIPEVARRLGTEWVEDTLSFSTVTTGAMKLQSLLRTVQDGHDVSEENASLASILMVVPMGEQHTLGAMSAAAWLRMKGASVSIKIAPSQKDLLQTLQSHRFDGIFVSIGSDSKLEVCAKLVKTLRSLSKGTIPVIIGGALAASKCEELTSIGADCVTTDLTEALAMVGQRTGKKRRISG